MIQKVIKTDEEWRQQLTPEQYRVARGKGTERAFSGEYCEAHDPGLYACVCCGTELFESKTKFESGTGWPSFTKPIESQNVLEHEDTSYGMRRVEVGCHVTTWVSRGMDVNRHPLAKTQLAMVGIRAFKAGKTSQ